MLGSWLAFPLALAGIALGCGLALDRATGGGIPGPLLLPAGLAVSTVVAAFTTLSGRTAELTAPALVGLAVLGAGLAIGRARACRPDLYAVACAVAAFLAVGAPVLASGQPTFTGYVKLDDTATFLALTDRLLEHGRDIEGLAPSSYEATLAVNLVQGYPTGALLPLGAAAKIVGTDPAWAFQPYLAFLAAMLALVLYALAGTLLRDRPLRALTAALASQPALLYGFALWGGVKELYAAAALALVAATVATAYEGPRAAIVPGVGVAATILALSPGAVVWLLPGVVFLLAAPSRRARLGAAAAATAALALSLPALLEAGRFLRQDNRVSFRDGEELGNLLAPLDPVQLLGIWPTGDFRIDPADPGTTYAVLAVSLGACMLGLYFAYHRKATGVLLYAAFCAVGVAVVSSLGSPWLEAKSFATASPAVLLLALVGGARLLEARRREALLALAVIAGGVLASNALAYREASLAPRAQLGELERIGHEFAGAGPALMTEYQPYGVRHFLRSLDAEGASELRRRPVPLRDGRLLDKGEVADLDAFAPATLLVYRTLVLERTPEASRPPASYSLVWRGSYYDVWMQGRGAPVVIEHLPLGDAATPAARAKCADVRRLARAAREAKGLLAAAPGGVAEPIYVTPGRAGVLCGRPLDWLEVVRA